MGALPIPSTRTYGVTPGNNGEVNVQLGVDDNTGCHITKRLTFPSKEAASQFLMCSGFCDATTGELERRLAAYAPKPVATAVKPGAPAGKPKVYKMPAKAHVQNAERALGTKNFKIVIKGTHELQKDLAILKKAGVIKADVGAIDADFGPKTLAAYIEAMALVQKDPNIKTPAQVNAAIHALAHPTKKPS